MKTVIPSVRVKLIPGKTVMQFQIKCPYCGEHHLHGGGEIGEDWRTHLGHRVSHCSKKSLSDVGYNLVGPED